MDTKIFLQGFDSKKSVNTSEGLNMSLKGKRRLLPTNDVEKVISQYDQYSEERENCNIIRLTCQVNPICSNVLFNRISEIVKDEGSSAITYLNYGILSGKTNDTTNDISKKIKYKTRKMPFWSGYTMHYQSIDGNIPTQTITTPITQIIDAFSGNYNTIELGGSAINHPTNAIRDMQLSNDNYIYHCGLDILNNHLIRSKTFKTVCKCYNSDIGNKAEENYSDYTAFNTIADLMRDVNGRKVVEKLPFPVTAGVQDNAKFVTMHLYEYDDIFTFKECIKERLIANYNGWVGFENKPKIKSYDIFSRENSGEETELEIERPIMYMNGGDFVDMYPDRSLYSFVPKYNKYRNRFEKNWNYCLTYPSSSTTQGFEDIIETSNNSLKALYFDENTRSDNGTKQLVIYSVAKHGLSVGDYVNIYNNTITSYTYNNEVYLTKTEVVNKVKADHPSETNVEKYITNNVLNTKILDNAEILNVVDDYIFVVFNSDIQVSKYWVELTEKEKDDYEHPLKLMINNVETNFNLDRVTKKFFIKDEDDSVKYYIINNDYVNFDDNSQNLSYKKVVNDIECDYYIRIFSKIPNFKNASADTSSEYQIYKNNGELIDIYQDHIYDFESHVSRLAFSKNIYTDEVGELVFTDDVDISNLKDNLGRPLSSIYLTIVKNNDGYKEWYGYDFISTEGENAQTWAETQITADTVEYSHCFGKVKCGIETCDESNVNSAIKTIYRVNDSKFPYGYNVDLINGEREYVNRMYAIDENEVYFDSDKHYYGDLSYYDNYNAVERHIQPIMQRFNTAQRESSQTASSGYYMTFIYDEITNDDYDKEDKYVIKANKIEACNEKLEGYYYNPHYEVPIKTFDKLQTIMPDFLTMRSLINTSDGAKITVLQNHYLSIGDKSMIYDMAKNKYYYCNTVRGEGDNNRVFTCLIYDEQGNKVEFKDLYNSYDKDPDDEDYDSDYDIANFKLFKIDNLGCPSYARILKDGTCRFIWRNILNNGFNLADDKIEEYPFTNGAFYINKRIDLYLRRQDPYGYWGLYTDDIEGNSPNIEIEDNYVKDTEIVC